MNLPFVTRRLMSAAAVILVAATSGCATAGPPPPGAVTADAAAPKVGSQWTWRVSNSANGAQGEISVTAIDTSFQGKPAYGVRYDFIAHTSKVQGFSDLAIRSLVFARNPKTFNSFGQIADGKVTKVVEPDDGSFDWPLWAGKSWTAYYTENGTPVSSYSKIAAYEEVTVPAGTFKAFRIERSPGMGQDRAGYATEWYAPSVALVVKSVSVNSANSMGGARTVTVELTRAPSQ